MDKETAAKLALEMLIQDVFLLAELAEGNGGNEEASDEALGRASAAIDVLVEVLDAA